VFSQPWPIPYPTTSATPSPKSTCRVIAPVRLVVCWITEETGQTSREAWPDSDHRQLSLESEIKFLLHSGYPALNMGLFVPTDRIPPSPETLEYLRSVDKAGNVHRYESVLVRRTYRDGNKVRHETLANLSKLPAETIAVIEATLKGQVMVPAEAACTITRSLPHGHVAAVAAMARRLGFPALLGPACRSRDLVLGLIISRVIRPASKLSTLSRWSGTTLGGDLGVAGASTDEAYAAMDWLRDRQDAIEKKLAAKHLGPEANPSRMAMFDLTSSWVTGRCCELAAYGYSRDGKKDLPQINYGLLTDRAGRPVAVRVLPGNTADPAAFTASWKSSATRSG
jgi:hypothetical protein